MKKMLSLLSLAALTALPGCNSTVYESASPESGRGDMLVAQDSFADEVAEVQFAKIAAPASMMFAGRSRSENSMITVDKTRKRVFSAELVLSVVSTDEALKSAQEIVEKAGGYIQSLQGDSSVLRIPVEKAPETLDEIEKLGFVTYRAINSSDVTDQVTELGIRLDNLEKMRQSLNDLLARGAKVADLLSVEKELNRVVTDIERYKAQLASLNNKIDYVTLTLRVEKRVENVQRASFPIDWAGKLGSKIGSTVPVRTSEENEGAFCMELPDNFAVAYSWCNDEISNSAALAPDDTVIEWTKRKNLKGATLEFWNEMIVRGLTEINGYTLDLVKDTVLDEGFDAKVIRGKRMLNNKDYTYQILFTLYDGDIYYVEMWAESDNFAKHLPALEKSYDSINISTWLGRLFN